MLKRFACLQAQTIARECDGTIYTMTGMHAKFSGHVHVQSYDSSNMAQVAPPPTLPNKPANL